MPRLRSEASVAERGKSAEKAVAVALSTFDGRQDTTWWRIPDARAGSRQPAFADFLLLHKGQLMLIEVKEVEHAFRLPYANFDSGQVARMRRFQCAGAYAFVLIHFKPVNAWRCIDLDWFTERASDKASWDTARFPLLPLKSILNAGNGVETQLTMPSKKVTHVH
jgi:hypothetical protein